jgi:hypothetical protein
LLASRQSANQKSKRTMSTIKMVITEASGRKTAKPYCSYCGLRTENWALKTDVGRMQIIIACEEHMALSRRDGRAIMHKWGTVDCRDVCDDPLWSALGMTPAHISGILPAPPNLTVDDTKDLPQTGWAFYTKPDGHSSFFINRYEDGIFRILAIGHGFQKAISLAELTLSLPEDQHDLVTAFIARIKAGVYSAEFTEHTLALTQYPQPKPEVKPTYETRGYATRCED